MSLRVNARVLAIAPLYLVIVGAVAGWAVGITCALMYLVVATVVTSRIENERKQMLLMLAIMVPAACLAVAIGSC